MSWKSKAWAFAGTVAALEELKAKKLCSCNSSLESLQQQKQHHHHHQQQSIKNMGPVATQVQSSSSSHSSSSSAAAAAAKMISRKKGKQENLDQSEESIRKIMYLSCWGPN